MPSSRWHWAFPPPSSRREVQPLLPFSLLDLRFAASLSCPFDAPGAHCIGKSRAQTPIDTCSNQSDVRAHPWEVTSFISQNADKPMDRHLFDKWLTVAENAAGLLRRRHLPELLTATAWRASALKADASTFSPSWMSIARRTFPARLELKRRAGSFSDAPLANVSFT